MSDYERYRKRILRNIELERLLSLVKVMFTLVEKKDEPKLDDLMNEMYEITERIDKLPSPNLVN